MQRDELRSVLKSVFRNNGYLQPQMKKILRSYGFVIEDKGRRKHILLIYKPQDIKFSLSRTPSDKRAGLQIVSNIMNAISRESVDMRTV